MLLREAWVEARDRLASAGIDDPWIEAEVLARRVLGIDRTGFYARLSDPVSARQANELQGLAGRRVAREPLAYITGIREFYGLEFAVSPDVLIPRQESELLVDLAVDRVKHLSRPRVADVGTGSGCLAIAIATQVPGAHVHAIEASEAAITVAARNRRAHGLDDRVTIHFGRDLEPVLEGAYGFDLIVSNPPYIPTEVLATLPAEVRAEPAVALDGGPDGLAATRTLLLQAPEVLSGGGRALVEIYSGSAGPVVEMASSLCPEAEVVLHDDMLRLPRVIEVAPAE